MPVPVMTIRSGEGGEGEGGERGRRSGREGETSRKEIPTNNIF